MSARDDRPKSLGFSQLLARLEPWIERGQPLLKRLRPYRPFLVVLLPLALCALALQLFSFGVTDDQAIRDRIAVALNAGDVFKSDPGDEASHFPECMSLSMLVREVGRPEMHSLLSADSLVWHDGISLCGALRQSIADQSSVVWGAYARYWHGSLVVERLWLDHFSYVSLKSALRALTILAVMVFGWSLARRNLPLAALVTVGLGLALSDVATSSTYPTQGVSLSVLFFAAATFTCLPLHDFQGQPRWTTLKIGLAAYILGAIYNYFDFLYNPGLFAGLLGWALIVTGLNRTSPRNLIWRALAASIAAIGGYLAMWLAKWMVTDIYQMFTGDRFQIVSAGNFGHWAMGGETSVWPLEATWILTAETIDTPWKIALAVGAVMATGIFAWLRGTLPSLAVACVPLLFILGTLEAASGHSVSHGFTARAIPWIIAAFCGGAIASGLRARPQMTLKTPIDAAPAG